MPSYDQSVSYTVIPITKSDATVYDPPLRWVDVLGAGDVALVDARGVAKTITVTAGYSIKCVVKQILATGTTATGFLGYP